jgi:hypothetical protein
MVTKKNLLEAWLRESESKKRTKQKKKKMLQPLKHRLKQRQLITNLRVTKTIQLH